MKSGSKLLLLQYAVELDLSLQHGEPWKGFLRVDVASLYSVLL